MRDYVLLAWTTEIIAGTQAAAAAAALMASGRWRELHAQPGLRVFVRPGSVHTVLPLARGRGLVLGNLFPRAGTRAGIEAATQRHDTGEAERLAYCLLAQAWGRYVLAHQAEPQGPVSLFRDPSGALDVLTWRHGGLRIIASSLPPELQPWAPAELAIDVTALTRLLVDPGLVSADPPLHGLHAVLPGELVDLATRTRRRLWTPARAARRRSDATGEELMELVDLATEAWLGLHDKVVAEVSGGLDSAIVATAIRPDQRSRVAQWVNYHPPEAQGDERAYAREVTDRLGVALTPIAKPALRLDEAVLSAVSQEVRPGLNGLDPQYDADLADRAQELGASAILGGQGGDAVFFQQASPWLAADALRRNGPAALWGRGAERLSQFTHQSVWGLWRHGLLGQVGAGGLPALVAPRFAKTGAQGPRHPWLRRLAGVPPAKRVQIQALTNCLAFHGPCRRSSAVDLLSPLLSQPVVEYCLGLSGFDLTCGRRDRALARSIFSERLPPSIRERESKGDLTTYYGRGVADNLDVLRPFLLGGRLVALGVLDPVTLDEGLRAERLIWEPDYSAILLAAGLEAWVRAWDPRVALQTR